MSELVSHTAVLSLCTDVKHTSGKAIPSAAFVIGATGERRVAALSFFAPVALGSPALEEICRDLPVVLPLVVNDALSSGEGSTRELLHVGS